MVILRCYLFNGKFPIGLFGCLLLILSLLWWVLLLLLILILNKILFLNIPLLIFPGEVWMLLPSRIISVRIWIVLLQKMYLFNLLCGCSAVHGKMGPLTNTINNLNRLKLGYLLSIYIHSLKSSLNFSSDLVFHLHNLISKFQIDHTLWFAHTSIISRCSFAAMDFIIFLIPVVVVKLDEPLTTVSISCLVFNLRSLKTFASVQSDPSCE